MEDLHYKPGVGTHAYGPSTWRQVGGSGIEDHLGYIASSR